MRELRRNQMKRLRAAGEDIAQIQPAESEASSKSGPVVSVSGQDQVRLTKTSFIDKIRTIFS